MGERVWLVTGGAGFIGSNIAEELVRQGKRVRVLDNLSTGSREHMDGFLDKIEFVHGDLRDLETCRRAMKDVDYVIHQAAIRSVPKSVDKPTESHEANATGTLHVLVAAREAKVKRVVYASTSSAYGDSLKFPQKEEYKPQPISPYGASKLCGENYCIVYARTMGLETISLRYFNVFGPRQDPESLYSAVIPKFMEQAYQGETLEVHWDGRQSRDFTHIRNVVYANLLAAKSKRGVGETFNIANGRSYSLLDIIRVLEKTLGRKLERRHHPRRAGDVRKTWADISRAKRLLCYRPIMGFEEGLRDTWKYFSEVYFPRRKATLTPTPSRSRERVV